MLPTTDQASGCATFVDEWVRAGLTDAVMAPGSRSTPLALALAEEPRLRVHVHHDERAAGFAALGLGLATGRPAILLTTSGTAAAELHAAVVEAHQGHVPLLVCTADRPPELQDVGAPQTIDQTHLFGRAVRWFCAPAMTGGMAGRTAEGSSAGSSPGGATSPASSSWRSVASRAVAMASGVPPGPVHLNLAFRDPLVGRPGEIPAGRADGRPWHHLATTRANLADRDLLALVGRLAGRRGVIVAGGGAGEPSSVHALARVAGWPVLADPRSDCRLPRPTTVAHADALLRQPAFARAQRPEVVLRLGAPHASRAVGAWLAGPGAYQVAVAPPGVWWDPDRTADLVVAADTTTLARQLTRALGEHGAEPAWLKAWSEADARAEGAIDAALRSRSDMTEPGLARGVVAALPAEATLVIGSSMSIRDVEWFAAPRAGVRMLANRGANGIDGVVSTALGVALAATGETGRSGTRRRTAALVGDVAFLHDATALLGATARDLDLVVVVVDNRGGGIFSFLPQSAKLAPARFEQLFGTPHDVRIEELAAAHGIASTTVETPDALEPAVRSATEAGGVWVVVARTDRGANVAVHDELNTAVATALAG